MAGVKRIIGGTFEFIKDTAKQGAAIPKDVLGGMLEQAVKGVQQTPAQKQQAQKQAQLPRQITEQFTTPDWGFDFPKLPKFPFFSTSKKKKLSSVNQKNSATMFYVSSTFLKNLVTRQIRLKKDFRPLKRSKDDLRE